MFHWPISIFGIAFGFTFIRFLGFPSLICKVSLVSFISSLFFRFLLLFRVLAFQVFFPFSAITVPFPSPSSSSAVCLFSHPSPLPFVLTLASSFSLCFLFQPSPMLSFPFVLCFPRLSQLYTHLSISLFAFPSLSLFFLSYPFLTFVLAHPGAVTFSLPFPFTTRFAWLNLFPSFPFCLLHLLPSRSCTFGTLYYQRPPARRSIVISAPANPIFL